MPKNPRVYFDIQIGTKVGGRVIFELFVDTCPRTAENFRCLCTGDGGKCRSSGRDLSYVESKFFRVIPGFVVQGGDFQHNNGDGGESIWGGPFRDENFDRKHTAEGFLSMANNGPHTNESQFYITLKMLPQLDNKHVVFGQVVVGMDVIRAIEKIPVDAHDRPRVPIVIIGAGELTEEQLANNPIFRMRTAIERQQASLLPPPTAVPDVEETLAGVRLKAMAGDLDFDEFPNFVGRRDGDSGSSESSQAAFGGVGIAPPTSTPMTPIEKRLFDLRLKLNQSRKLNLQEVTEEKKKLQRPNSGDRRPFDDDDDEDKSHDRRLFGESASVAQWRDDKTRKKTKNNSSFAWDVFNQNSMYRAHKKRLIETPFSKVEYENQKKILGDEFYNSAASVTVCSFKPSQEAKDRVASVLEKQLAKRANFSRRRAEYVGEEDVSYINERNRSYNKKLERSFGTYSLEYRQNLERETAL